MKIPQRKDETPEDIARFKVEMAKYRTKFKRECEFFKGKFRSYQGARAPQLYYIY